VKKEKLKMKKATLSLFSLFPFTFYLFPLLFSLFSCSFDYGNQEGVDKNQPDLIMENVEYVRVRSADPQARFQAERLERYEERGIIELRNFSFEQFSSGGEEINASGRAGSASVEINSGNIRMDNDVRIDVETEDLAIETKWLEWKDKERTLTGGEKEAVNIYQESGTAFTGTGFHADARRRTWEFDGNVSGTYIYDDDEDETNIEETAADTNAEDAAEDPASEEPGV
jgi:LPS export ABC transporter protein LptC